MSSHSKQVFAWAALAAAGFVAGLTPQTHAQEQLWIRQFGTSSSDYAGALTADGAGGVFVGGATLGALGGRWAGGWDAFLARYDDTGKQLWLRQFGSGWSQRADALAPDGAGGVWVAGSVGSQFAPGADIYLARYDSAGNRLITREYGSADFDYVGALAPDGAGGVFLGGRTAGDLGGPNAGVTDAFVARFNAQGHPLWTVQFGTVNQEWTEGLVSDGAGGVFVGGWIDGIWWGPKDAFVARYDSTGERLWFRRFGTAGDDDWLLRVTSDSAGGLFIAGVTDGSLGGPSLGEHDAFLARYDGAGNRLWIRQFGTADHDAALALAPDGAGGAIVAGQIEGTHGGLFDPVFGDVFLARYDDAGNQLWIRQFGTGALGNNLATALASHGAEEVTVAGYTNGSLGGPNAGELDAFLTRFTVSSCYPDCDGNGTLDIFDFLCFQNSFVAGEPYACGCDPDPACDIFDFLCFQNAFVAGCP